MSANVVSFRHSSQHEMTPCHWQEHRRVGDMSATRHLSTCRRHVGDMSCLSSKNNNFITVIADVWKNVGDMSANVVSFCHSSRHEMSPCRRQEHRCVGDMSATRHITSAKKKKPTRHKTTLSAKLVKQGFLLLPYSTNDCIQIHKR